MNCIFPIEEDSGFGLNNLPFCVYKKSSHKYIAVRVGNYLLNLTKLENNKLLQLKGGPFFGGGTLNAFSEQDKSIQDEFRKKISDLLILRLTELSEAEFIASYTDPADDADFCLPFDTNGFTDFYSSEEHARNVGTMFRDPENALNPNWKQLPVAYNGRASTIVPTGTEVSRPKGIIEVEAKPTFTYCQKLDFEVEMGFFIGKPNSFQSPISIDETKNHIFGMVIVNDWSARDVQKFEYVPLGPFLSKSFATSISPYVIPMESLKPFARPMPPQDFEPVEYLQSKNQRMTFDIKISLSIETANNKKQILLTNFSNQYWSMAQQLAHHTVNGSTVRSGDLLATGTLSGNTNDSVGSLLEMTLNGKNPIEIGTEKRTFLEDGDKVILEAFCEKDGEKLSFGKLENKIVNTMYREK